MEKPKQIIELEKILKMPFNLVDYKFVGRYSAAQSLEYSLTDSNEINGLCITEKRLYAIPEIIGEMHSLRKLFLNDNQISDISVLSKLTSITSLYLHGNNIRNIAPISTLRDLDGILLMNNQISDLSVFAKPELFPNLKSLYLRKNNINNLVFLKNLNQLESLGIDENPIKDLKHVQHLSNLKILNISKTQITDLSPIKQLLNLQQLNCSGCNLSDITPLADLKNLKILNLESNQIDDISAIKNLSGLTTLTIRNNPIKKLEPWICDFPNMDIRWEKFSGYPNNINLYDNPIENVPIDILKQGKAALFEWFIEYGSNETFSNPIVNTEIQTEKTTIPSKPELNSIPEMNKLQETLRNNLFVLIDKSLNEKELDSFCNLHFQSINNSIANLKSKEQKINLLFEHCRTTAKLSQLAGLIANVKKNPLATNDPAGNHLIAAKSLSANQQSQADLLAILQRKKLFLQKEMIITYDAEKKFALQEQILELEKKIFEILKQKEE